MSKINYKRLRKFDLGGKLTEDQQHEYEYLLQSGYSDKEALSQIQRDAVLDEKDFDKNAAFQAAVNSMGTDAAKVMSDETLENYAEIQKLSGKTLVDSTGQNLQQTQQSTNQTLNASPVAANMRHVIDNMNAAEAAMSAAGGSGTADGSVGSLVNNLTKGNWMAAGADALVGGMKAVDQLTMGDKNFDAQSQAIDSAVHGISGALMKSGNPWGLLAGAGLETMNFATKAFGQTTEGFDVDISSGGYGNMGHMDSKSNRDFGAAIGLGGLNVAKMDRQLQERNEAAQMALQAARISDDQKLEQEARMSTVNETLMKNKIALAGGIDTTTLGA